MTITIEKGVHIPRVKTCNKYPFRELKRGNSFIAGDYTREFMQSLSGAIQYYKKIFPNRTFACRKTDDNKIRVFRTK